MATIKAIEGRSVHQIQSGQVIVDLNSVVKELVENSLDAGASSIEVRFKNNGLDSIEVQDNGKGIAPEDYETIALKHYTSKLSSYEDLTSLETFGFRGEALSSLCALSKFQILTARAEDGAVGRRLEFEVSGKLKGASVVAAQKGTTVAVEDLFHSLPVRRKELEKNIKREYSKVINLLNAYACISVGVRYSVSNIMPKGKKVVVFSTKSNTTTRENIVNVFGSKTLLALVKLDLKLEMEPGKGPSTQSSRNRSTQAADRSKDVQVEGHISKPVFGEGRQAPDRQMFFVNSRPCALPQVSKAVNEVYKSFNVTQSPFIFANLVMDTNAYDVNVSPDKRTIMLHDQTALLDSLKAALTDLFEHTDHTVPQSTLPNRKLPSYKPLTVQKQTSTISSQDAEEEPDDEKEQPGSREESPAPRVSSSRKNSSGEPASLIESWAGRDSDMRKTRTAAPTLGTSILGQAHPRSNGQRTDKAPAVTVPSHAASTVILHAAVPPGEDRSEPADGHKTTAQMAVSSEAYEQNPMSTSYDDPFSQRPPELPRKVQDFNSYIERSRNAHNDSIAVVHEVAEEQLKSTEGSPQPSIPAVKSSTQKPTPGPVPNAFDRMRPKRTPLQTAEITVGDQTTTTIIGSSPAYKKRRVHEPVNSQAVAAFGCSPLLARGLRSFAAPGTQMAIDGSEVPLRRNQPSDESEDAEDDNDDEGERAEDEAEDSASEAGDAGDRPENTSDQSETDVGDGSTPRRQRQRIEPTNTRLLNSDALDDLSPAPAVDDEWDEEYIDENENRMIEDEKITRMIQAAEKAAARPSSQNLSRAFQILKSSSSRKDSTLKLACRVETDVDEIRQQATASTDLLSALAAEDKSCDADVLVNDEVDATQAENKLSLTVTKADFSRMRIIGQFNLGFILAVRPATTPTEQDELFIIDQHAADEKYNYERLQRTVTLQSQRLVRPKTLDLTAVEQEIVLTHSDALKANGFEIETTTSPSSSPSLDQSGTRTSRLLTLPTSHTTTFTLSDLSELLYLLSETSPESSHIPRPKKVQRMLAMRACRSSIMVGKSLTVGQMERVVRHMGEMEKPWNCPHGRPTMRHLAGLGAWRGWREGELIDADVASSGQGGYGRTDWRGYLSKR